MRTGSLEWSRILRSSPTTASSATLTTSPAERRRVRVFDDVDAEVGEHHQQVVDLVGGKLRLARHRSDLGGVQVVLFAALGDEPDDLVAERLGGVARPGYIGELAHGFTNTHNCQWPAEPGLRYLTLKPRSARLPRCVRCLNGPAVECKVQQVQEGPQAVNLQPIALGAKAETTWHMATHDLLAET